MIKKLTCILLILLTPEVFGGPTSRPSSSGRSSPARSTPSSRPSSRPSTPSSRPSTPPSRPSTPRPSTPSAPSSNPISSRPSRPSADSAAIKAQRQRESAAKFQSRTPKNDYISSSGKQIKIDTNSKSVKNISNMDSEKYKHRSQRIEKHYHHHYGPRYDYYRSQPIIDIGGGFSCLFWYAMMDWSLERRALWLYHHQSTVNSDLYTKQLENAQLKAEIERLKARKVIVDANYVDNEFRDNPDLMYDDNYVKAVYNPDQDSWGWDFLWWVMVILISIAIIILVVYLASIKEWNVE